MNRKEFLSHAGLGAAGIFLAPAMIASAWRAESEATEAIDFAMKFVLKNGATYADARVGSCEVMAFGTEFANVEPVRSQVLGMRFCTEKGWQHVVLRDLSHEGIETNLGRALKGTGRAKGKSQSEKGEIRIVAHFSPEKTTVRRSSDPETESALNTAWMRYAAPPALPENSADLLFCDLLLEQ